MSATAAGALRAGRRGRRRPARPTSTSASRCRRPGPAASLGIPEKNTFELLPTTIGGQKVNWIVLDDASDTTKAVTNTKKLISEDKVDVDRRLDDHAELAGDGRRRRRRRDADDLDGGLGADHRSGEPEDEVGVQDAAERRADGRRHRRPHEGQRREDDGLHRLRRRATATAGSPRSALRADRRHQDRRRGEVQPQRRVGHRAGAEARRRESRRDPDRRRRHARRDAAEGARRAQLQGQDLPDARRRRTRISCASSARTATARCCRSGPMLVYEQLPDSNPVKKAAAEYITKYEAKYGKDRARRSAATRGMRTCCCANAIPEALKKAKPGTKEFRVALRDALESEQGGRRQRTASSR